MDPNLPEDGIGTKKESTQNNNEPFEETKVENPSEKIGEKSCLKGEHEKSDDNAPEDTHEELKKIELAQTIQEEIKCQSEEDAKRPSTKEVGIASKAIEPNPTVAAPMCKPKRISRLADDDKPPEDPKFRFLSDPERDGKSSDVNKNARDTKKEENPTESERENCKKVSRIPSVRRRNRPITQCENCRSAQNGNEFPENPAEEQRENRGFQRNSRVRSSYPVPQRHDSRGEGHQKWGHAMYYELYGEEQPRPQRHRGRGWDDVPIGGGGPPRHYRNSKNENRSENNDHSYNNKRHDSNTKTQNFSGPKRQDNNGVNSKLDDYQLRNRQNYSNGKNGDSGGHRGRRSFRGRGSSKKRSTEHQPSSENKRADENTLAITATE